MSTLSQDICDTRGTEIECLNSLSTTLQTGLSKRAIAILLELIESGVHPESLVDVVEELRAQSIQESKNNDK